MYHLRLLTALAMVLYLLLCPEANAFEDEDVIIIWGGEQDQILIPLGDGFYTDLTPPPQPEPEVYIPDHYKYPITGYPN